MSHKDETVSSNPGVATDSYSLREESDAFSMEQDDFPPEGTEDDQHLRIPSSASYGLGGTTIRAGQRKPRKRRLTDEEKKVRRIMSNRRSAKASRDNRRKLLTDLSSKAAIISAENKSLAKDNAQLRTQAQHLRMRLQLALSSLKIDQVAASAVAPPPSPHSLGWFPQGGFLSRQEPQEQRELLHPLPYQDQPSTPLPDIVSTIDARQYGSGMQSADYFDLVKHQDILVPNRRETLVPALDLMGNEVQQQNTKETIPENPRVFPGQSHQAGTSEVVLLLGNATTGWSLQHHCGPPGQQRSLGRGRPPGQLKRPPR